MESFVCNAYKAHEGDQDEAHEEEDESEVTIEIEFKQKEVAPQDVRAAYRRGLELYEEGFGGEGLEPSTIRVARAIARGEAIGEEQIRKGYRFWARNERFLEFDDESPAGVAALLWGGRPGMEWFRRLYSEIENEEKAINMDDLLITFGDELEVKRLEGGGLEIKGYAVRFTGPGDTDLEGDYFTGETDFGSVKEVGLYYQHGLDKEMGRKRIGSAKLDRKDAGLWMEAQMKLREDYEKAIEEMVRRKKMGISSGAAGHLVERVKTEGGNFISQWPIGEVSLTPTPAEPRNVVSLKSLLIGATSDIPETTQAVVEVEEPLEVKSQPTEPQDTEVKMENENKAEIVAPTLDQIATLMDDKLKAFTSTNTAGKTTNVEFATSINNKTKRGDDEVKALAYFIRTGDAGAIKASNDTDMNVGDAADGGNSVPTGHFQNIIARRDESMLARQLGVTLIPGKGRNVDPR
jgi:hypothetical protein